MILSRNWKKHKSIRFKNKISLLFIYLLIVGCTEEYKENLINETLHVDATIAPYFERFIEEGEKRGFNIDLEAKKIEGFLIDIEENEVVGQCSYNSLGTRKINIDINYWNRATDLEKEFVVFHELGHCYLGRSHDDTQNNRSCNSIMHSGTSGCRFRYNSITRTTYLNELFEN